MKRDLLKKRNSRSVVKQNKDVQAPLDMYLGDINNLPLLTLEEEIELSGRVAEGDPEARDMMIRSNLRLVVSLARNYIGRGLPLQDIIEEGNLGLIRAVEGYDVKAGTRFSTYASYWVTQAIRRALINTSKVIRLPAYMVEIVNRWRRATNQLAEELGRTPFPEEIGRRIGIDPRRLPVILKAIDVHSMTPSTDPMEGPGLEGMVVDEKTRTPDDMLADEEAIRKIKHLLNHLTERESLILRMRYGLEGYREHTLRDVGKELRITRERVRQIERMAIEKLGHAFDVVLRKNDTPREDISDSENVEGDEAVVFFTDTQNEEDIDGILEEGVYAELAAGEELEFFDDLEEF